MSKLLTSNFLNALKAKLPKDTLREVTPKYLEEPRGILKGNNNSILALPKSTQEVSIIVKTCQEYKISITPYSGGNWISWWSVKPQSKRFCYSFHRADGFYSKFI